MNESAIFQNRLIVANKTHEDRRVAVNLIKTFPNFSIQTSDDDSVLVATTIEMLLKDIMNSSLHVSFFNLASQLHICGLPDMSYIILERLISNVNESAHDTLVLKTSFLIMDIILPGHNLQGIESPDADGIVEKVLDVFERSEQGGISWSSESLLRRLLRFQSNVYLSRIFLHRNDQQNAKFLILGM